MARLHLSVHTPTADGPLQAKLDEHDTALDAVESAVDVLEAAPPPADDVIERQTLGADAQEVTFALAGNTDEVVQIEGIVIVGASGALVTCKVNDNATPATYHGWTAEEGVGPVGHTNHIIKGVGDGVMYFRLLFHCKTLGSQPRGGTAMYATHRALDTYPRHGHCVFRWGNTAAAVTTYTLRGDTATFFKLGSVFIVRRRKVTA